MNKSIYSLEYIKNKLSPVFLLYNVKSAVLFGSYAKGYATESSDIDLLVDTWHRNQRNQSWEPPR